MGNAKPPYTGAGYGLPQEDDYQGILWDVEELPYFKGVEMPDEKLKATDVSVLDAHVKKLILEKMILDLIRQFEKETFHSVSSVIVVRSGEMGKLHGEVWSVEVEAVL